MQSIENMTSRTSRILQVVSSFASSPKLVNDHLVSAPFFSNGLAGKLFIESDASSITSQEKFKEYQDTTLSEEYYSSPGALKWNLYLVLVYPEEQCRAIRTSGFATELEEDLTYARKLVVAESEVFSELPRRFDKLRSSLSIAPPDLIGDWIQRLHNADLDGVYIESEAMDKVVGRLMEGSPIKGVNPSSGSPIQIAPKNSVHSIRSMSLRKYRPCLQNKVFDFGQVNLIAGRNGAGKTSLLEAIELWTCGKTYRNPKDPEAIRQIGLRFAGARRYRWNRSLKPAEYRSRALSWYGIHKSRTNRLHEAFGRFNFFDTDAATRLAKSTGRDEIGRALEGLVLGREAAIILERARGIGSRLAERLRSHERLLEQYSHERARIRSSLTQARDEATGFESSLFPNLRNELKSLKINAEWLETQEGIQELETKIPTLIDRIELVGSANPWLLDIPLREVDEERGEFRQIASHVEIRDIELGKLESKLKKDRTDAAILQQSLETLEELRKYMSAPNGGELIGLSQQIESVSEQIQHISSSLKDVDEIGFANAIAGQEAIGKLIADTRSELRRESAAQQRRSEKLERLRNKAGEITRLLEELISSGTEILNIQPDRKECPLCNHSYQRDELERRVMDLRTDDALASSLADLELDRAEHLKQIDQIQRRLHILQTAQVAAKRLLPDVFVDDLGIRDLNRRFRAFRSALTRYENTLLELKSVRTDLESRGLTEVRLAELEDEITKRYPKLKVGSEHLVKYDSQFQETQLSLVQVESDIESTELRISNINSEVKEILQKARIPFGEMDVKKRISHIEDKLAEIADLGNGLLEIAGDAGRQTVGDSLELLRKIAARISAYRRDSDSSKAASLLVRRLERQADTAHEKAREEKRICESIESWQEVLQSIIEGASSGTKIVGMYLESSLELLDELFSILCWPRDFSGIKLRKSGLVAVPREQGSLLPITRLSAGQRAALALSLFLAMNSCVTTAPPYILLDEPLMYFDDLNALAFFDVLRLIVRNSDKQVFLATADPKLSSLFRRKFDFLGEAFRSIELPR